MQTKLLHVIEDKEVRPIGGEQARKVDTRIVAATNRDLGEMVKQGRFREDLYFRLSQFLIHIPPLRDRREDIPRLIRYVMQNIASNSQRTLELDPMAEEILVDYAWPGNVRELENVVNRAHILADGGCITVADLPPDIARAVPAASAATTVLPGNGQLRDQLRRVEAEIIFRTLDEYAGDRRGAAQKLGIGLSSLYRKLEEFAFAGISHR